ncbi:MAG: tetratricopeptide repeat protein, partial [Rhodothermales bacterium]|nr:tetratricopeptide repeat protein [Rhodothermales bacterium]
MRQQGDLDAAATQMRRIRDACPDYVDARLELAVTLSWNGKLLEAIDEYDGVLDMQPAHEAALLGRARVLSWKGDTDSAREIYLAMLLADSDHAGARNGLAFTYRVDGRFGKARQIYRAVLTNDPSNGEAIEGLYALRGATSLEGTMTVGQVTIQDGRHEVGNYAGLVWRPSGTMTYSGSVRTTNRDSGLPLRTALTVGANRRMSRRVSLGIAYEHTLADGRGRSATQFSASIRAGRATTLLAALKPARSTDRTTDLLLSAGIVQSMGSRGYFILQVFEFRSSTGYRSRAYATSGRVSLSRRIEVRP